MARILCEYAGRNAADPSTRLRRHPQWRDGRCRISRLVGNTCWIESGDGGTADVEAVERDYREDGGRKKRLLQKSRGPTCFYRLCRSWCGRMLGRCLPSWEEF